MKIKQTQKECSYCQSKLEISRNTGFCGLLCNLLFNFPSEREVIIDEELRKLGLTRYNKFIRYEH